MTRGELTRRVRKSARFDTWRRRVIRRDNATCVLCGKYIYHLALYEAKDRKRRPPEPDDPYAMGAVDHIEPLGEVLERHEVYSCTDWMAARLLAYHSPNVWNPENGRVLCADCYKETETFGAHNTAPRVIRMKSKDGTLRSIPFRPDLAQLTGDVWSALILQQLCYWTTRSNDPDGWVYKTASEMLEELAADQIISERAVRRRFKSLEDAGLIVSADSARAFDRTKRYQVNAEVPEISGAIEASATLQRPVSGRADTSVPSIGHQRPMERTPASAPTATSVRSLGTESTTESTTEITAESIHDGDRVRDESTERVMVEVEKRTGEKSGGVGLMLGDSEAKKLLEHASGDIEAAVQAFVDVWTKYRNAPPYKLIAYAADRIAKGKSSTKAAQGKRQLGLREPEFDDDDREVFRREADEVEF